MNSLLLFVQISHNSCKYIRIKYISIEKQSSLGRLCYDIIPVAELQQNADLKIWLAIWSVMGKSTCSLFYIK